MQTLKSILSGSLSYESSWAVYAEKIDGQFEPESPARFGQPIFENGGMLDDCEMFGVNTHLADSLSEWLDGSEDGDGSFTDSWIDEHIGLINSVQD